MAAMLKTTEEKRDFLISTSHDEVVISPDLFMETLMCFHSLMGTTFMIPVIGKKKLDLYNLYLEVTRRGGFRKVVDGKMWMDIGRLFQYPPTSTNISYLLRNHYINLLYQFELFYFCKVKVHFPIPTGGLSVKSLGCAPVHGESTSSMSTGQQAQPQIRVSEFPTVIGTLDAKFENGYLVTVKMGSKFLHGVLYHPSSTVEENIATVPTENATPDLNIESSSTVEASTCMATNFDVKPDWELSVTKKKRSLRYEVPKRPTPNRSGYNFFFSDKYSELKAGYSNSGHIFTRMIAESWNHLSQEERVVYEKLAVADKERYQKEIKEYQEKLHGGTSSGI